MIVWKVLSLSLYYSLGFFLWGVVWFFCLFTIISVKKKKKKKKKMTRFLVKFYTCTRSSSLGKFFSAVFFEGFFFVIWTNQTLNHCKLFNAKSCFYICLKYAICKHILWIHTVKCSFSKNHIFLLSFSVKKNKRPVSWWNSTCVVVQVHWRKFFSRFCMCVCDLNSLDP